LRTRGCVAAAIWNGRRHRGGGGCGLHPLHLQASTLELTAFIAYNASVFANLVIV